MSVKRKPTVSALEQFADRTVRRAATRARKDRLEELNLEDELNDIAELFETLPDNTEWEDLESLVGGVA